MFANVVGIAPAKARFDPYIEAFSPAQLLQHLQKCREAGL
jgi:hypothetical protein